MSNERGLTELEKIVIHLRGSDMPDELFAATMKRLHETRGGSPSNITYVRECPRPLELPRITWQAPPEVTCSTTGGK